MQDKNARVSWPQEGGHNWPNLGVEVEEGAEITEIFGQV